MLLYHTSCVFDYPPTYLVYTHNGDDTPYGHIGMLVFMQNIRYCCHILMKLEFSRQIFGKYSNIKFHENSSGGSRDVPCGRKDVRTHMTKLTVAFRNFANTSKNEYFANSKLLRLL
jgi:hypothetical protein